MVPVVGNWFNAQQVFNDGGAFTCSAGQSIAEYCSKAQDSCCAVCPNAPITGPGTLIVMTLGTFINLLFVLWYQSEAPYNLAYQIVATDGAAFGLLNRLIQPDYRLSQFHYALVPMAIMSCIPLAFAAVLNDYPSYHSHTPNAYAAIAHKIIQEKMSKGGTTPEAAQPLLGRTRTASTHSNHSTRSNALGRSSRSRSRSGSTVRSDSTRTRPASINLGRSLAANAGGRPSEAYHVIDEAQIPRKYLITTAWIFFSVHLLLWPLLFAWVYFINDKFNQPQCNDKFHLKTYSVTLAIFVFGWWFFAVIVWVGFTWVLFFAKKKRDLLELIGTALHITTSSKEAGLRHRLRPAFDSRSGVKRRLAPGVKARARSIMRWSISIGVFWIWAIEYCSIYFIAVRDFVLIGTNGFDFGQVVAVVSIGVPAFLIMRAQLDYNIYWDEARKIWAHGHDNKEQEGRRSLGERDEEGEEEPLPDDYQGLQRHRSVSTLKVAEDAEKMGMPEAENLLRGRLDRGTTAGEFMMSGGNGLGGGRSRSGSSRGRSNSRNRR